MQISVFSHPKRRDKRVPSDDTLLIAPGIWAVFDGATDARSQQIGGRSSGRFASETAASRCAVIFADPDAFHISPQALARQLNEGQRQANPGFEGRPATTLALMLTNAEMVRFIAIGDSGIRINGAEILQHLKPIDDVSAAARVRVFGLLADLEPDPERREAATRKVMFHGLDKAVSDQVLDARQRDDILAAVARELESRMPVEPVIEFLCGGIITQYRYANRSGHPLGYSALNGTETIPDDILDKSMSVSELRCAELFTDGYFHLPGGNSIHDWEEGTRQVELEDYHMLDRYRNVKGATRSEFADDRAVIILDRPQSG